MIDINERISRLDWHREPYGLYEPIAYTLDTGGKRLRPQLLLLANQLFGGNAETALPAALAIEIFHNFTLLHDDVMDRADTRRGRPTVHVRWNDNTAILSGDQMLIEAYKQLSQLPENKQPVVFRLFSQMATGICEGQQYDMEFEQRSDVSIDEYMRMIRLKTSVLLAYALQIGAYIAGADEGQQQALYDYGISLGLAFQIQDDLLDVYGDPATFGKAIGGDILCGKKTYMLLTALSKVDSETRQELLRLLQEKALSPDKKIAEVTHIYDTLNIRQEAEQTIQHLTEQALLYLSGLPDNEVKNALISLAQALTKRNT